VKEIPGENVGLVLATPHSVQRPRLQRLLQYWEQKRGDRRMPARADLDPLEFRWMLGDVSLVEVHRDGDRLRYRFRLMGTRAVERLGYDITGKWLEDLPRPDYRALLVEVFGFMVARAAPHVERPNMLIDDQVHHYEILRLPLGRDGYRVDMLMMAVDFTESENPSGMQP
jgi:hypothetical protein